MSTEQVQETKKDKKKEPKSLKKEIMSWILTLLAAVVIAGAIRMFLFEPIRVDGNSMANTLLDGEIVLVTKPAYLAGNINRGDVVICRYPDRLTQSSLRVAAGINITFENHTLFVKRLVALPGDSVEIREGVLYVNDEAVDESWMQSANPYSAAATYARRVLGEDEYFVLGDNRAVSHDSHSSDVGPISRDMIVGHVRCVLWPLNKIGGVK